MLPAIILLSIDPYALVNHVENLYISRGTHAIAEIEIKKRNAHKKMKIEMWSKGRNKFLIRILYPPREKGISTLRNGKNIWNYFPDIDKVMRIPPSLMSDSWMGSHFTYDDLLNEVDVAKDYTLRIKEERGDTIVITAKAKENAAVVWDGLEYYILKTKKIPLKVIFKDERGNPVNVMTFSGFRKIKGRWIPMEMTIKPIDRDEYTRLKFLKLQLDIDVPEKYFSLQYLRR